MKETALAILAENGIHTQELISAGNTAMKRHSVFITEQGQLIKLFFRDGRMEREVRACHLAHAAQIPAENIAAYGFSHGSEYLIADILPGEPLMKARVNPVLLPKIWQEAGYYLALLHHCRPEGEPELLSVTQINDWFTYYIHTAQNAKNCSIEEQKLIRCGCELFASLKKTVPLDDIPSGLSHGDYNERNILVKDNKITGIIDFEMSIMGNTEIDIARLLERPVLRNPFLKNAFLSGYLSISMLSPSFAKRRRLYLLADLLFDCSWSHDQVPVYFAERIKELQYQTQHPQE